MPARDILNRRYGCATKRASARVAHVGEGFPRSRWMLPQKYLYVQCLFGKHATQENHDYGSSLHSHWHLHASRQAAGDGGSKRAACERAPRTRSTNTEDRALPSLSDECSSFLAQGN